VIHKERYDRFITDAAWQIITSSASDQKALDNFNLDTQRGQVGNHSPFAAALLEALEGAADAYPPAKMVNLREMESLQQRNYIYIYGIESKFHRKIPFAPNAWYLVFKQT
jgi:hypothetical protein